MRSPLVKIKPLTEMQKLTTVRELRAFVGMANFLRNVVKDFSALVVPMTDILRNKESSAKRARHKSIPWGPAQDDAFATIVSALVSPLVLMPLG